jgi:hypothetical protein
MHQNGLSLVCFALFRFRGGTLVRFHRIIKEEDNLITVRNQCYEVVLLAVRGCFVNNID